MDDPRVWWRRTVDAVIALRRGQKEAVAEFLRWVESLRGREVAEKSLATLRIYAKAEKWADVESWPAWGYACAAPRAVTKDRMPKPKRKRR